MKKISPLRFFGLLIAVISSSLNTGYYIHARNYPHIICGALVCVFCTAVTMAFVFCNEDSDK